MTDALEVKPPVIDDALAGDDLKVGGPGEILPPKRPLNAFMLFCASERLKIRNQCGRMTAKEMGKELGRRWAAVEQVVKADWKEQGRVARVEYRKAMAHYKIHHSEVPVEYEPFRRGAASRQRVSLNCEVSGQDKHPGPRVWSRAECPMLEEDYYLYLIHNWPTDDFYKGSISGLQVLIIIYYCL